MTTNMNIRVSVNRSISVLFRVFRGLNCRSGCDFCLFHQGA